MELCKEAIDEGRIEIKYAPTNEMKSDGLTKALEGASFIKFANDMLGYQEPQMDSDNRWALDFLDPTNFFCLHPFYFTTKT